MIRETPHIFGKATAVSLLALILFLPLAARATDKTLTYVNQVRQRAINSATKKAANGSDAANYADPADRATQEEEFSLELRTRDRERKLIKKIDESLITLDTGDYGYCESCGIEIGIRRLEARPTATQCIDCKTLQEIKEKQIYS